MPAKKRQRPLKQVKVLPTKQEWRAAVAHDMANFKSNIIAMISVILFFGFLFAAALLWQNSGIGGGNSDGPCSPLNGAPASVSC